MSELQDALTAALSGVGATLGKPDWAYRDLTRMKHSMLAELLDIIGPGNSEWITYANYGDSVRGQILISPEGMKNLSAYSKGPQS